jgi:adenine-specific DNA methylase
MTEHPLTNFTTLRVRAGLEIADVEREFAVDSGVARAWEDGTERVPARVLGALKGLANHARHPELPLPNPSPTVLTPDHASSRRAIECDCFPFEFFSDLAEVESWRKELHRPIYHIHKWWAQRLGSVFRAILLGSLSSESADVRELFYKAARFPDATVFDPFMGSGTTIGEALKLGARAIGRDINPVAHFLVKNALAEHPRSKILQTYHEIEQDVSDRLKHYYKAETAEGFLDVLYYFWVKVVECPACASEVDLFSNYVFARHAYARKYPSAHAICPNCGDIHQTRYDAQHVACGCGFEFDPQNGPARGAKARCDECTHEFKIVDAIKRTEAPPRHRLYAKQVLLPSGQRAYLRATEADEALYREAADALKALGAAYPSVAISPGYNTNQARNYNYLFWHQMFNERQLLCLSILSSRIAAISDEHLRNLFACLFSGMLEFNNLFTSFKGEGTGAVRHMFAHHVLKPERVPLEANVWGTPKNTGSFSTLFEGRLKRALDYADRPFEIRLDSTGKSHKVYGLSDSIGYKIADDFEGFRGQRVYLSCGDSSCTDIPDRSLDLIVTDPPFFDNVHYSELADFFHVWQRYILTKRAAGTNESTRSDAEVQSTKAETFTSRLAGVFKECERVLRDDGLMVFTYHHSRAEGWQSLLEAIGSAKFEVSAVQPIKAEMSVAMPKLQAAEPIDLDIIVVCRKRTKSDTRKEEADWINAVHAAAARQVSRFKAAHRRLSRNDVRVIVTSQALKVLSGIGDTMREVSLLESATVRLENIIDQLHLSQLS